MNPLELPRWEKKKVEIKLESRDMRSVSFGVRAETILVDRDAKHHITIEVRGVKGTHSGAYKVAYAPGQKLGDYLRRLRLKRAACYSAVYDLKAVTSGRLRMTYVPQEGAHIAIGSASLGVSGQYQRSSVDAQQVAARMGGGARTVEVKK